LFSLVFQSFQNFGLTALYQLNKKFVAEKLCENKSRPKMHCNGKCYLNKQLEKSAEEQSSNKLAPIKLQNLEYIVEAFFTINTTYRYSAINHFPISHTNIVNGFHSSIFHPPLA